MDTLFIFSQFIAAIFMLVCGGVVLHSKDADSEIIGKGVIVVIICIAWLASCAMTRGLFR